MSLDPKRVEAVFAAALEQPTPAECAAYLDAACAGEVAVRQRVDALLKAHAAQGSFLDHPVLGSTPPASATIGLEPSAPTDVGPGTRVRYVGDYELLEEIARGGMGVVYKARQTSLHRIVALKMILAGQLASEADVQRFYAEARAAGKLKHPHIVAIHEAGAFCGQHYFSMDYIEGHTLAEQVRDHPLPVEQAARYVQVIASAIDFAHRQGTLHRDLKPSNVLIDADDQPHVTDFGLAKNRSDDAGLTATGAVMGTPSYMAPEQARGQQAQLGPACDIYSLGALLYELVTGRPPFRAATMLETLRQVTEAEAAPPRVLNPAISRDLETIILKCLAKEPARRYRSAQALADDLQAYRNGMPIRARRPSLAERSLRWLRQQQGSLTLMVKAIVLFLTLGAGGWLCLAPLFHLHQASLHLETEGLPLSAAILPLGHDQPLLRLRVPHENPVSVPAGAYRVRLALPGMMDEMYPLTLEAGTHSHFSVQLGGDDCWPAHLLERGASFLVVDLEGPADILCVAGHTLSRLRGATRKPIWEVAFQPHAALAAPPRFPEGLHSLHPLSMVQPAPDLDGDGLRDLLWIGGHTLWALSGKDGKELWWQKSAGRVLGMPLLADVTGTAKGRQPRDLVVTRGDVAGKDGLGVVNRFEECWIEALAGEDGSARWRYRLDGPVMVPTEPDFLSAYGDSHSDRFRMLPPRVWSVPGTDGKAQLVCMNGTRLVVLNPRTGQPTFVHDLGFRGMPQFADLDQSGHLDAIFVKENPQGETTLVAVSLTTGKTVRQYPIAANRFGPLIVDLDGDGRPEIVVVHQDEGIFPAVEVLQGSTGQRRWQQRLRASPAWPGFGHMQQILMVGPDGDGDGWRDLFVALDLPALPGEATGLQVEALSGRTGSPLWRQIICEQVNPLGTGSLLGAWPTGKWVGVRAIGHEARAESFKNRIQFLDARTGRVAHTLEGAVDLQSGDLDGDGHADLVYRSRPSSNAVATLGFADHAGQIRQGQSPCLSTTPRLHALRGGPIAGWQQDLDEHATVLRGRPLPWTEPIHPLLRSAAPVLQVLAPFPFLVLLALCIILSEWLNLGRLLVGAALFSGALALAFLALDVIFLRPGQGYDPQGWEWIGFLGASLLGIAAAPPLLVYGFLYLGGVRPRWLPWLGTLGLCIGILIFVPMIARFGPFFIMAFPVQEIDHGYAQGALLLLSAGALGLGPGLAILRTFWPRSRSAPANPGKPQPPPSTINA